MTPASAVSWLGATVRRALDRSFFVFFALAVATGVACWMARGPEAFNESLREDADLIFSLVPKVAGAALVAALVPLFIPRETIARLLGESSGVRGVAIATAAGSFTPGGPMTSFPLVSALHAAGSGRYALIAYVSAWSIIGVQRILMWELPLLGVHFVLIRLAVSIPLPFIAAGIARIIAPPAPPTPPPADPGPGS